MQFKYSGNLNQDRYLTENVDVVESWFDLYQSICSEHKIAEKDKWKMDEKRYMMSVAGSAKVIVSRYEKQAFSIQSGNREWATTIIMLTAGLGLDLRT